MRVCIETVCQMYDLLLAQWQFIAYTYWKINNIDLTVCFHSLPSTFNWDMSPHSLKRASSILSFSDTMRYELETPPFVYHSTRVFNSDSYQFRVSLLCAACVSSILLLSIIIYTYNLCVFVTPFFCFDLYHR